MKNSNNHKDLIIAFLGGAIAGGVLAYLAGTDQAKEIVDDIKELSKEKYKETKEIFSETEDDLKTKLKAAIDNLDASKGLEKVKDTIDKVGEKIQK